MCNFQCHKFAKSSCIFFFFWCRSTYLNTISPWKSDGACHCNDIADLGDGDECVAVLSKPPQLISLIWLSDAGANRPT